MFIIDYCLDMFRASSEYIGKLQWGASVKQKIPWTLNFILIGIANNVQWVFS